MKGKLVLFSLMLCALQAAYGQDKELKLVYETYYPEVPAFVSSVSDELVRETLLTGYREAKGEYTVRLCHEKYLCEHTYTNGKMEDGKRVTEEQFGSMMAASEARKQARGANSITTVTTITHSDGSTEVIEE